MKKSPEIDFWARKNEQLDPPSQCLFSYIETITVSFMTILLSSQYQDSLGEGIESISGSTLVCNLLCTAYTRLK